MAGPKYDHQAIEKKWQERWLQARVFSAATPSRPSGASRHLPSGRGGSSTYVLDMFPYPSSDGLHVGHPEGYTASDIVARYLRMKGNTVLHPMGWDAFGLPAENAAIKKKTHPRIVTEQNVKNFKRQIQSIGFSYDWDREINTTDPKYYKWTQWIFLQLFKRGLAYEAELPIWWCPRDKTGLANEEVVNGCCERCGTKVERKMLRQWVLKITAYAERLLKGLDKLDWPESIKTLQRNWIGRSEGAEIKFGIKDLSKEVMVFTTRPDTLFGATYLVLSPEHPLIDVITTKEQKDKVENYKLKVASKSDLERTALEKEKTGVFTGAFAVNPVNNEKIPVWIADYVLMSYGTGAIMAVPAHDERDYEFAKKFKLPIRQVIAPLFVTTTGPDAVRQEVKTVRRKNAYVLLKHHTEDKYLCLNWEKFDWRSGIIGGIESGEEPVEAAKREIREETGYQHLKFVRTLGGEYRNHYYAGHKKVNRYALGHGLLFQLEDDVKTPVEPEHTQFHAPVWIKGLDMAQWLNMPNFLYMWRILVTGKEAYEGDGVMINGPFRPGSPVAGSVIESRAASPAAYGHLGNELELVGYDGPYDELSSQEFRRQIVQWLEKAGRGKATVQYKLRDWVFSRQRYWGEPIPLVHCPKDGAVPIPEKDLPVLLPDVEKYEPTGTGESPLAAIDSWVNTTCPKCGGSAKRETNTMPQWAGSCWYYIRFCDPHNDKVMASPDAMKAWLPVDLYVGGAEHAVLHLLYARFWHMALYDAGAIPKECGDEPFMKLKNQGLILGPDGEKMSKSRGNVINPDEIIEKYGADTLRMYEMFMGPFEDAKPWSTNGIIGVRRFLDRVWRWGERVDKKSSLKQPSSLQKEYVHRIEKGIQEFRFNTCVSDLMKWVNKWNEKATSVLPRNEFETFLKALAPFAPHIAEHWWHEMGNQDLIATQRWPDVPEAEFEETATYTVQVNGKLRAVIELNIGLSQSEVETLAKAEPNVSKYLKGKKIIKVIFVKDRLISFVI